MTCESRTKASILRSKARWYREGEKSTKYFLNLEKIRYNQRTIICLIKEDGTQYEKVSEKYSECRRNSIKNFMLQIQMLNFVL